jgi:NifB/MoaA-like Fe-S oxidoreductase
VRGGVCLGLLLRQILDCATVTDTLRTVNLSSIYVSVDGPHQDVRCFLLHDGQAEEVLVLCRLESFLRHHIFHVVGRIATPAACRTRQLSVIETAFLTPEAHLTTACYN